MGIAVPERTNNKKIILPKISFRDGAKSFSNTMTQFHRTRTKKVVIDESSFHKSKDNKNKKKEVKRNNSVKLIE